LSQFALRMAAYAARIYGTRNPFDIIEQRAINFKTTPRLVDTLGFYAVVNNRRFIRLSEYATEVEQLMAAGHELGHDFFDREEARTNGPLQDTWFYSLSSARQERRANLFSAELMITVQAVLESIGYYDFKELLEKERKQHPDCPEDDIRQHTVWESQTLHDDFCTTDDIAHEQGVDPVLIEFKYKALLEKGFELPVSPELRNDYLKK
jgi:hypothetical protein